VTHKFSIEIELEDQTVNDILDMAFAGGINYWCDEISVHKKPEKEFKYLSEVLTVGGELLVHELDEGDSKILTLENFLKGIQKYFTRYGYDPASWDASTGDLCVQFALFDELVYA
jgi:hypothetical protein